MTLSLLWEKIFPTLFAIGVCVLWNNVGRPFPMSPDGVFGAASTVASIFAGFLGVSQSIILTIKDTPLFKAIKARGYDKEMFSYLRAGIVGSSVFTALSLGGFFINDHTAIMGHIILNDFHLTWIGFATYAFLTFFRMTSLLFKMLRHSVV